MKLAEFNSAEPARAAETLRPCIDVARWVDAVAAARPFASKESLLAFASQAASPFSSAEVESAMAHHPRIGERPTAATTEASMSRSGRTAPEILRVLNERLANTPAEEDTIVAQQLREIAVLRLEGLITE